MKRSKDSDGRQRKLTDFFAAKAAAIVDDENGFAQKSLSPSRPTSCCLTSPLRPRNVDVSDQDEDVIPVTPEPCRKITLQPESKKRPACTVLVSSPKRSPTAETMDDDDDEIIMSDSDDGHAVKPPCHRPKVNPLTTLTDKDDFLEEAFHPVITWDDFDDDSNVPHSNWIQKMHERFGRHVVDDVARYADPHRVVLKLKSTAGDVNRICILQDFWMNTVVAVGDTVHVLADFDEKQVAVVCNNHGLIIVDPDVLVSGTTVVSTVFCMRKTVLGERFKGVDCSNLAMVVGKLVHTLFQEVVSKRLFSRQEILDAVKRLKDTAHLHDVYGLRDEVAPNKIDEEVAPYLGALESWMKKYVAGPAPIVSVKGEQSRVQISEVHDIEENIWSPRLGLKGKIDMTVGVKIHRVGQNGKQKVMPLELKTGRDTFSPEHTGQTMLYTMMMEDKMTANPPTEGLLLYLKQVSMKEVPDSFAEKRGLIQLRNELVFHLKKQLAETNEHRSTYNLTDLPDPNCTKFCERCPHLTTCSIYTRDIEKRNLPANHRLSVLADKALSHLSPRHVEYFQKWCCNVFLEERSAKMNNDRHIWCLNSRERERNGDCFAAMILASDTDGNLHTFTRKDGSHRGKPLSRVGFSVGEYIVVSDDEGNGIAAALGPIQSITDNAVVVSLDRSLRGQPDAVYRLDRHALRFTSSTSLTNLARLMGSDRSSERVRKFVVDRQPPAFADFDSGHGHRDWDEYLKPLNDVQRHAVLRALACKDFLLIKGFPGAGKTATIVCLIRILHSLGQSVLLTSHTNTAVDNVLVKLLQQGLKSFLRIGHVAKVHDQIVPYTAHNQTKSFTTVEQLRAFYNSQKIVGVTCYGINHPIFAKRTFDVCIVDEATQVSQPTCLGPLFCAERFVLVGDPKQLAPIVNSVEAKAAGMEETIFSRLDRDGSSVELNIQYRMNGEITKLANALTYGGALKCADRGLADSVVQLPNLSSVVMSLLPVDNEVSWLKAALSNELSKSAVFLNTDEIPAHETRNSQKQVLNEVEGQIVASLAKLFIRCGCPPSRIGLITPYRNQMEYLTAQLGCEVAAGVEVSTVDRFQGRDKEVIMMSCVRTGTQHSFEEIMHDTRRLNVSLTRAKRKLVLVGSRVALRCYQPFKVVLESLRQDQVYDLPPAAHLRCKREADRN